MTWVSFFTFRAYCALGERQTAVAGVYSRPMMLPPPYRPEGIPPGHSVPLPIVPAGKLYTTRTVLSSGENFKMANFGWVLSGFAPGPAARSFLAYVPPPHRLNSHFSICIFQFASPLPPAPVPRFLSGTVVLSWYCRATVVLLACYRRATVVLPF